MAGLEEYEFGWQRSQQVPHEPIFESSHSKHVQRLHASEVLAKKKWLQDAEARKKTLLQEAKLAEERKAMSRRATRYNRGKNAKQHGDSLAEHHGDDLASESEEPGSATMFIEEPFVPWTPYVPPQPSEVAPSSPRKTSPQRGATLAAIDKEIGVKRMWSIAHRKASARMNEVKHAKAISDASNNVHRFLLYSKSQASVKKIQSLYDNHEMFTNSTRYRTLARSLRNPAAALQAFEDSIDYESHCYFSQLSDALVPLSQNAKKRQAETQQLRQEEAENEKDDVEHRLLQSSHKQVHVDAKMMMTDAVFRLQLGVAKAMKEFATCSQEIVDLRRDYSNRLAYYHKYWDEMGDLERRQHYIQGIIQECEDRRAEIEKRERAKIEGLEDQLKQLQRQADILEKQCDDERVRSGSVFSWIVRKIEESQSHNVNKMLQARLKRQLREATYQKKAVAFRKQRLRIELRQKKRDLAEEQQRYKRQQLVATVLDLRLHALEASGLMLELKIRDRDLTHDGLVLTPDSVSNGMFQLILREIDAQVQWFADRCQLPWEVCHSTLRVMSQPALTSPLALLRCIRELLERWQNQERNLAGVSAKSAERRLRATAIVADSENVLSESIPENLDKEESAQLDSPPQAGLIHEEELIGQTATYTATLDLGESVQQVLQQWKAEDNPPEVDAPTYVENSTKTPAKTTDLLFAAMRKTAVKRHISTKSLKKKQDASPWSRPRSEQEEQRSGEEPRSPRSRLSSEHGGRDAQAAEECEVSGRPSCLNELANLPETLNVVKWVADSWVRFRPSLQKLAAARSAEVVKQMDDILADLQEAGDIAETSMHWVTAGARGPGVFSDMLLKDLTWLMRLADRIAERVGTLRAIVEVLTAASLESNHGPFVRALDASSHLLRLGKPLVSEAVLHQAERWHLRLMKALHAEACFHGACNSALRWYCGKVMSEGSADVAEISRGVNVLSRLLNSPQIEAVLDSMMSSELYAEVRLALLKGLQKDDAQAYESALLALGVLHSSTAGQSIGTSYPPIDMPEEQAEPDAKAEKPLSHVFHRLWRMRQIASRARSRRARRAEASDDESVKSKSSSRAKPEGEDDDSFSSDSDLERSPRRLSQNMDLLLQSWATEVQSEVADKHQDDLGETGSTSLPNSTLDSLLFESPKCARRFSSVLHHAAMHGDNTTSHAEHRRDDVFAGFGYFSTFGSALDEATSDRHRIAAHAWRRMVTRLLHPDEDTRHEIDEPLHESPSQPHEPADFRISDNDERQNPDESLSLSPSDGPSPSPGPAEDPPQATSEKDTIKRNSGGWPVAQPRNSGGWPLEVATNVGDQHKFDSEGWPVDIDDPGQAPVESDSDNDTNTRIDASEDAGTAPTGGLSRAIEDAGTVVPMMTTPTGGLSRAGSRARRYKPHEDKIDPDFCAVASIQGSGLSRAPSATLPLSRATSPEANIQLPEEQDIDVSDFQGKSSPEEDELLVRGRSVSRLGSEADEEDEDAEAKKKTSRKEAKLACRGFLNNLLFHVHPPQEPLESEVEQPIPIREMSPISIDASPTFAHAPTDTADLGIGNWPKALTFAAKLTTRRLKRLRTKHAVGGRRNSWGLRSPVNSKQGPKKQEDKKDGFAIHVRRLSDAGVNHAGVVDLREAAEKGERSSISAKGPLRQGTVEHNHHWLRSTTQGHLTGMHGEGAERNEAAVGGRRLSVGRRLSAGSEEVKQHLGEHQPMAHARMELQDVFTVLGHHIEDADDTDGHADSHKAQFRRVHPLPNQEEATTSNSALSSDDGFGDEDAASDFDFADADRKAQVLEALESHNWEKKLARPSTCLDLNMGAVENSSKRPSMHDSVLNIDEVETPVQSEQLSAFRRNVLKRKSTRKLLSGDQPSCPRGATDSPDKEASLRKRMTYKDTPSLHNELEGPLYVHGHHQADVNDSSKPGGDADVCSFADLAPRKLVGHLDLAAKNVTSIEDQLMSSNKTELMSSFLDHKALAPGKSEALNGVRGQIGQWLAKIEPEVALSTLAGHKANGKLIDESSLASTVTPETPIEMGEHADDQFAEGWVVSKVLSPRFPVLATPGASLPGSARELRAKSWSPKKRRAGIGSKASPDDQVLQQKFQPSAADQHHLETMARQQAESISWLKKLRGDWQSASNHDAEWAAYVARNDVGFDSSKLVMVNEVTTTRQSTKMEASTIFPSGRLCGTPGALVGPANLHLGHGQGAPGVTLHTMPTLKTEKGLRPVSPKPWPTIDGASGEHPDATARMLRDLRDIPGPGGSRNNSPRTTPASSRSPPKSLAKRRRRELHDSL